MDRWARSPDQRPFFDGGERESSTADALSSSNSRLDVIWALKFKIGLAISLQSSPDIWQRATFSLGDRRTSFFRSLSKFCLRRPRKVSGPKKAMKPCQEGRPFMS